MNIELLEKIKQAIKREPLQFNIYYWFTSQIGSRKGPIPNCGTAACIAGWAVTIGGSFKNPSVAHRHNHYSAGMTAQNLLSLSNKQADKLFHFGYWPSEFQGKTFKGKQKHYFYLTPRQQASLAIKRIDHFIKTNGAE